MATTYEFIFNEGPMGLQIDHDCLVEEIDVGEQASTCPDLKIGHLVTHVNGQEIPAPKFLDQLHVLIGESGRPMTLRFSTNNNASVAAVEEEDVASLVQQVSKARREMNSLRQTLEASQSAGSNEETVKKITNLLVEKEKTVRELEQRLDAAGYEKAAAGEEGEEGGEAGEGETEEPQEVEEDQASNPLKVNIDLDELEEKKKKKKRGKSSFRKFSTIIGRAFTTKKKKAAAAEKKDEEEMENESVTSTTKDEEEEEKNDNNGNNNNNDDDDNNDDANVMKKKVVLLRKMRDLKFELVNSRDDDEIAELRAEMKQIEARLLALDGKKNTENAPVMSSFETGDNDDDDDDDEQMVSGENILDRGPITDPSSSMRWEEEKESLPSILETSEREEREEDASRQSVSSTFLKQQQKENDFKKNSGARSFGDVGNIAFDPADYRTLEEDVYELYERQFLVNGRQSSMSMVSTDDQIERNKKAIHQIIKYYGKPLLVLFRAYANSAGINRIGNKCVGLIFFLYWFWSCSFADPVFFFFLSNFNKI